jgi:REP element-mobilizing transposase RayT
MARPLRIHRPGTLYHVISRGDNKRAIFADEDDYKRFLNMFADAALRFLVRCYAYCLMWNHFHLLVEAGPYPISRMMQQLNSAYCQSFNRRQARVGHVLQGRFKAPIVDSDVYFMRVARYIVRNPVAAQIVTRPEDWLWSSYRATVGLAAAHPVLDIVRILTAFDVDNIEVARQQFACFVNDSADDAHWRSLFLIDATALAARMRPELERHRTNEDFIYAERFATRPPLWDLLPGGSERRAIRANAKIAFFEHAYTLREIGKHVRRPTTTIWRWVHDE